MRLLFRKGYEREEKDGSKMGVSLVKKNTERERERGERKDFLFR